MTAGALREPPPPSRMFAGALARTLVLLNKILILSKKRIISLEGTTMEHLMRDSLVKDLAQGLKTQGTRTAQGLTDPRLYGLLLLGGIAWLLPRPLSSLSLGWLLGKALFEEFIFRFVLQETLSRVLRTRFSIGPVGLSNILASAAFSGVHFLHHSPIMAGLTFFPSLVFGYVWDRHGSLALCGLVHFFYNFCLFYRPW